MSLATRCPICEALFRVTPEQLRQRRGQVRCGCCSAVFDGLAHLVADSGDHAAQPDATTASPHATLTARKPSPPIEPAAAADATPPAGSSASAPARLREWKTITVSALLLVLLVAQLALLRRDMLAAEHPPLRGILVALCGIVRCEVRLPRLPDRLSIEGDEMIARDQKDPSRIELVATLRNSAAVPVAYPSLELSLLDAREEVVARRVLGPADYLPDGADPAHGLAARGDVNVRLELDTGTLRAEGYRLYLFYP